MVVGGGVVDCVSVVVRCHTIATFPSVPPKASSPHMHAAIHIRGECMQRKLHRA